MGDRAHVVFTDGESHSPAVYLHWHGALETVKGLLELAADRMRTGDLSYSCARFIGVCHEQIEGNLSLGVWNLGAGFKDLTPDQLVDFKHYGEDNGLYIVNVKTWDVVNYSIDSTVWDKKGVDHECFAKKQTFKVGRLVAG